MVVISDKKIGVASTTNPNQIAYYNADVMTATDFYPFGFEMPGRKYNQANSSYRYGFGGQERSTELHDNSYTAEYWQYDSRLGRRWNRDIISKPWFSDYAAFGNNPIYFTDPDGREPRPPGDFYDRNGNYLGTDGKDDGKIYLMNGGLKPKFENTAVNWGSTLSKVHATDLQNHSSEVGGLIIQNRVEEGKNYTISEFKTVGGDKNIEGFMLEPAGPSTATPNQDKRIPEGVYDVDNYSSTKYPDNFILSNDQVSKDRKILYHPGNNGANTEGCNMPGTGKGDGVVTGSKAKMQELRTFIKSEGATNVKTIINNNLPEKK